MPTLTTLLLGLSTTLLSLLGLLLLPHLVTLLTPPTILAVLHSTILLFTAFLVLLILRHLLSIPINAFHSTAYWWYLRYVYLPRFTRLLGSIYRRFRGRALVAAAVGGLLIPVRCGFEWDLFLVVTAHWVALLAACVSVEEIAVGGEWVMRYWWWCVEVLAVSALLLAF